MKKVALLFIASVTACLVQAGTVNWSLSQVYTYGSTPSATTSDRASGYIAYLLVGDSTSGMTALAGQGASAISTYVTANNTYGGSASTSAGAITYTGSAAYSAADVNVYAVVFDAASINAANHFYVTSVAALSIPANGIGSVALGKQKDGTTNVANWYAVSGGGGVPEPTSGLLLVLGGAMLALRRRRA